LIVNLPIVPLYRHTGSIKASGKVAVSQKSQTIKKGTQFMAQTSTKIPTRKPVMKFPSVHARQPQSSANYDTLGLAFKNPTGNCVMSLATFMGAPAKSFFT
jgi:hypothetical protein